MKRWHGTRLDNLPDSELLDAMAQTLKIYQAILLEIATRGLNKKAFGKAPHDA